LGNVESRLEDAMQPVRLVHLLFLGLLGVNAYASEPIVHTQNGDVRGVSDGKTESFKDLPFAAPPVGNLRWMPPQDPHNWAGVRDASHFSQQCPQMDPNNINPNNHASVFVGDEDCLYLNVFRPSGAGKLPVIVFIHGGSEISGSASLTSPNLVPVYDGSRLAESANVVVVTLNYRLGPFGYIGHPELSRTSPYGASGNYAYMDQIQALKWVRRNIAAFGGNPKNVTLSGHSAGATSVWVQMTSPLSKDLFQRAIVHSGIGEPAISYHSAEDEGKQLAQKFMCPDPGGAPGLACLRDKSAKDIIAAMPSNPGSGAYNAVVDMYVLTDSPIAIMRRGEHHHVPILQGNVEDERSQSGEPAAHDITDEPSYEMAVEKAVHNGKFPSTVSAAELLQLYPASDYNSPPQTYTSFGQAYNTIFADEMYICPSREVLTALSATTQGEFVGRFFYTHVYSESPYVRYGAAHGFELPFIFDTLSAMQLIPTEDEAALVKTWQNTWSYFARKGTAPPSWKRYDAQRDNYAVFDTPMSKGDHLHTKQCDFWDAQFANAPGFH
jgi:para-nitrobenzyl esterase